MKFESIKNKKVIVRVDYNVPIKNGNIDDTSRIDKSVRTIKMLISNNNSVILMSHMGSIKTLKDKKDNTLYPVYLYLKTIFNKVSFSYSTSGKEFEDKTKNLKPCEILLVENTRYEDLQGNRESKCSKALASYWAKYAEAFVFDAFASIHRNHASTYGISMYLPSYMGYLVNNELNELNKIFKIKHKTLILGGSKVESKIGLIKKIIGTTDYLLIGGAMCFTFLTAKGYNVGNNFVDEDKLEYAKNLLTKYKQKIVLPIDFKVNGKNVLIENLDRYDKCYDIGQYSIKIFESYLKTNYVVWNGPLGYAEKKGYDVSTKEICNNINNNNIFAFILGGDTVSCTKKMDLKNAYYSTGGGASLEYLSGTRFKILEKLKK